MIGKYHIIKAWQFPKLFGIEIYEHVQLRAKGTDQEWQLMMPEIKCNDYRLFVNSWRANTEISASFSVVSLSKIEWQAKFKGNKFVAMAEKSRSNDVYKAFSG